MYASGFSSHASGLSAGKVYLKMKFSIAVFGVHE